MSTASRYRPYIIAIVAVLILVLLPGPRGGSKRVETTEPGSPLPDSTDVVAPAAPAADNASSAPTVVADSSNATAAGGSTPSTLKKTAPTTALGTISSSPPKAASVAKDQAARYPGIGTAAALDHPKCDRAKGRIRLPTAYAPPCVAPWPAGSDNGGATYQGVTKDTIKLVLYLPNSTSSSDEAKAKEQWNLSFDTYNKHLELWGRRVEVVTVVASGSDEVAQRADAIRVATDIKPFASTTAATTASTYSSEVAARGIIEWDAAASWNATQKQAPFRWGSQMDDRSVISHVFEYVGKRLVGRPARWSGNPADKTKTRTFGLIYPDTWDKAFVTAEAASRNVPLTNVFAINESDLPGAQERNRTIISRMKADGVTSIIDGAGWTYNVVLTAEPTTQAWFPEWVMTGWNLQDVALFARLYDKQQWSRAFGIGPVQVLPPPREDSFQAVYRWHHGVDPPNTGQNGNAVLIAYLLMPCIQLAGPNLTPQTFRDGCFANAPSGGSFCGCTASIGVQFGKRPGASTAAYTGWTDMTEKWWDPSKAGPDEAGLTPTGGQYMKVDGGKRYVLGTWPTTEPKAFDPNGAIDAYPHLPPNEQISYEHGPPDAGK